jgi:hypothetical protein
MAPRGRPRKLREPTIRTTVDLPEPLWRLAKIKAMDERKDLRSIIIEALEEALGIKAKKGSR